HGAPGFAHDSRIGRGRGQGLAGVEPGRQRHHPFARHRGRAVRTVRQAPRPAGTARQQCARAGGPRMAHRPRAARQSGRPAEGQRPLADQGWQEQYQPEFRAPHGRRRQAAGPPGLPRHDRARQRHPERRHFLGRPAVCDGYPEPVGPDRDERRIGPVPEAGSGRRQAAGRAQPASAAAPAQARLPRRVLGRPGVRRHQRQRHDPAR
ncbi:hypothetical protein LTR94_030999, partial [Friedmanniomyces endolithicus]